MIGTAIQRSSATDVIDHLMSAAFRSQQAALTDLAQHTGLLWRCFCTQINKLHLQACERCEKPRRWTEDDTPENYGPLLEDLREALAEWFDDRPKLRRPAAIGFRVTTEWDDGPAWATWDTTAYFTDSPNGQEYPEDFERSSVAHALAELDDFAQPQTHETLRVVVPPPFATGPAAATAEQPTRA
ncbi:hypothetical protein [Streptomyces sp. NPDC004267]|uniref:hypothetical protein n=1 Tax=Streptomyces sp. NPDC004267 TaxID=3364694 RepID=UPI0036B25BDA